MSDPEESPGFQQTGRVSLWIVPKPIAGVHADYLEGCDQLFMWLVTDYGVAVDGAFATNFTEDREPGALPALLEPLHGSEHFAAAAQAAAHARGLTRASFVVALYDCAYDPDKVGLRIPEDESDWLAFVGHFPYA